MSKAGFQKLSNIMGTYGQYAEYHGMDKDGSLLRKYIMNERRLCQKIVGFSLVPLFNESDPRKISPIKDQKRIKMVGILGAPKYLQTLFSKFVLSDEIRKKISNSRDLTIKFTFLSPMEVSPSVAANKSSFESRELGLRFDLYFDDGYIYDDLHMAITEIGEFGAHTCMVRAYQNAINDFMKMPPQKASDVKKEGNVIVSLIKLSNHFDSLGLTKEADYLDSIIKKSTRLIDQLDPEKFDEEEEIDDNNADDKVNCG